MVKMKILIVDNEPIIKDLLHDFLVLHGYHVDCTTNGFDALKLVENGCYNLLIVDFQIPGLNGVEFLKRLKERWTSLPVFAMSTSDVKDLFREAGANLIIPKPINIDSLNSLNKEVELLISRMNTID